MKKVQVKQNGKCRVSTAILLSSKAQGKWFFTENVMSIKCIVELGSTERPQKFSFLENKEQELGETL